MVAFLLSVIPAWIGCFVFLFLFFYLTVCTTLDTFVKQPSHCDLRYTMSKVFVLNFGIITVSLHV